MCGDSTKLEDVENLRNEHLFKEAMTNLGMPPKAMIIWNKVNPAQHLDKYFKQHEIIFYYGKFGGEKL